MSLELKIKDTINKLKIYHKDSEWKTVIYKICDHPEFFNNIVKLLKLKQELVIKPKQFFSFLTETKKNNLMFVCITGNANTFNNNNHKETHILNLEWEQELTTIEYAKEGCLFVPNYLVYSNHVGAMDLNWDFVVEIILTELKDHYGLIFLLCKKENVKFSKFITQPCYKFFIDSWLHPYGTFKRLKKLLKNNYDCFLNEEKVLT